MTDVLKIFIPPYCHREVEYVFNCYLTEFLDVEFELTCKPNIEDFIIRYKDKSLIIKNHFYKTEDLQDLMVVDNLPNVVYSEPININDKSFPLITLFGTSSIEMNDDHIFLDSDIIAAAFFMLSRWEESLNSKLDAHSRFQAKNSIAYKFGFLERPIVNEYIEILWYLIQAIGYKGERKLYKYSVVPTHDVDIPFLFEKGIEKNIRLAGGFIKRGEFSEFFRYVGAKMKNVDPWDTHDLLMNLSEKINVKSHIFFLPNGRSKYDQKHYLHEERVQELISRIKNRGHHIGLHPSYNSYTDRDLFLSEKNRLYIVDGNEPRTGRQHYLRFKVPETWQVWEDANMLWDSSVCYADMSGFRCGIVYPFPVFNIHSRKTLKLFERPLVIMDTSIVSYENINISNMIKKIEILKNQVKMYNGEFVFLYHNSSFFVRSYHRISEQLLNTLYN